MRTHRFLMLLTLLLAPLLACTDMPAGPNADTAEPLFGWWPEEPGDYIVASANGCGQAIPGPGSLHFVVASLSFETSEQGYVQCSVIPDAPTLKTDWVPDESPTAQWSLSVAGESYSCFDSGEVSVSDLPVRVPDSDSPCFYTKARFVMDRISLD